MSDDKIHCPFCGQEMEPVCEERRLHVSLLRKRSFYDVYMRCPQCGAQGPKIQLALNQDEALLAAAAKAKHVEHWYIPHDESGVVHPERLEGLGIDEMEELAHLWHEAKHGRVSVWPVAPGADYWHLQVYGDNEYTEEGKYLGQHLDVKLQRRKFRVVSSPFGSNEFRSKKEALEKIEQRWPGLGLSAKLEEHAVRLDDGRVIQAEVATGDLEGETIVPDEAPAWEKHIADVKDKKEDEE